MPYFSDGRVSQFLTTSLGYPFGILFRHVCTLQANVLPSPGTRWGYQAPPCAVALPQSPQPGPSPRGS